MTEGEAEEALWRLRGIVQQVGLGWVLDQLAEHQREEMLEPPTRRARLSELIDAIDAAVVQTAQMEEAALRDLEVKSITFLPDREREAGLSSEPKPTEIRSDPERAVRARRMRMRLNALKRSL